jgi:AGCS family alanine or glycine:cation symporter
MGGAMYYLSDGLKRRGLGGLGMVLAVIFALMCVGGSIAGGNSYQVNQSMGAMASVQGLEFLAPKSEANPGGGMGWIYGAVMTFLTGIVILGGIKRIAQVAEKIVPIMCGTYILACLYILFSHFGEIPAAIGKIIAEAFDPETVLNPAALKGGFIGVLIVGFQRAAFSNEAGVGSAAIAHSAAKTDYPVREGIVALLEPFIDTVVVCTMTALVIVITGAYNNPEYATIIADRQGATLTSRAFGERLSWFPYVLAMATALFAYSTMISWSYYGERCWVWLFGEKWSLAYKLLFLSFTFLGSVITATQLLDFGDLMILGMALPNILGVLILSGEVRKDLNEYWKKFKAGEFKRYS